MLQNSKLFLQQGGVFERIFKIFKFIRIHSFFKGVSNSQSLATVRYE
jgi:hypothetical protein